MCAPLDHDPSPFKERRITAPNDQAALIQKGIAHFVGDWQLWNENGQDPPGLLKKVSSSNNGSHDTYRNDPPPFRDNGTTTPHH